MFQVDYGNHGFCKVIINSNKTYIEHYGSDAFKYLLNGNHEVNIWIL